MLRKFKRSILRDIMPSIGTESGSNNHATLLEINDVRNRIRQLEIGINKLHKIISSTVSYDPKLNLHYLSNDVERRLRNLEKRFDVSNAAKEGSVVNVCMKQTKELERIRDLAEEFFECINSVTEDRNYYPFNDKVEHKNVFKVKRKDEKYISAGCLRGLALKMKKCEKVSLYECFKDCEDIEIVDFPEEFNTYNVISMTELFRNCNSLTSLNLSTFNTSNVTSMSGMFDECRALTSLDLSTFNTSNVTSMYGMFYGCGRLS